MKKPNFESQVIWISLHFLFFLLFPFFTEASGDLSYFNKIEPIESKETIKEVTLAKTIQDKRVVLPLLKGIIIRDERSFPPTHVLKTLSNTEFYRTGQEISEAKKSKLKRELNKAFVGKPLIYESLRKIKQKVQNFYADYGKKLVIVTVSEEEITNGIVQVCVLEARCGKVNVEGNKWLSEYWYLEQLNLEAGSEIYPGTIDRDVDFVNQTPWRKMSVAYKEGQTNGITDIDIAVRDFCPFQVYAGADNTGFKITDYTRVFAGVNWGNFFNLDQILSLRFTSSPDFKKSQEYAFTYTAPLPWHHFLKVLGAYSRVDISEGRGASWNLSPRYLIPFAFKKRWSQEVGVGLDLARTDNNVIVGESFISPTFATLFNSAVTYKVTGSFGPHFVEIGGQGYLQPWSFGVGMSDATYSLFRLGAKPRYFLGRFKGEYVWTRPRQGVQIAVKLQGQGSSAPLIPIQQFGLGGVDSVRGYAERAVNVDDALTLNFELRLREIPIFLKNESEESEKQDAFRMFFFVDIGTGRTLSTPFIEGEKYLLAGIGPGMRYDLGPWVHLKFDWGFRLTKPPSETTSKAISQPYFTLVAVF